MYLFTDGSVNTQSKIGVGCWLWVSDLNTSEVELQNSILTKSFTDTSSTLLEIQVLLHALSNPPPFSNELILVTDSQNIEKLPGRRAKLEGSNYRSKKGELIKNEMLYKSFYEYQDKFQFTVRKVKGHSPGKDKGQIEKIFTLVDRAARRELRESGF